MGGFDFSSVYGGNDPYFNLMERLYQRPENNYFDTSWPEYQSYVTEASKPTPSEGILKSFINRMPQREEYEPSTGRKIGGFLLGMLSGYNNPSAAYKNTREFVERPYTEALMDWKNEAQFIDDRARLEDAARNRQLGTLKFGLENKARGERYRALSSEKALDFAGRTAGKSMDLTNKDEDQEFRSGQADVTNKLRKLALDLQEQRVNLSREGLDFRKDQEEWDRTHPKTTNANEEAKKVRDRLQQDASGLGIPYRSSTPSAEIARSIAWKEVLEDPTISQYIEKTEDPSVEGGIRYSVPDDWKAIVQRRIQARINSLLKGLD